MKSKPFDVRLLLALIVCLGMMFGLCYRMYTSANAAVVSGAADFEDVKRLAGKIVKSRVAGDVHDTSSFGHSSEKIEASKLVAKITDRQNSLITDHSRRQVSGTNFIAQPTQVKFADISVRQLIEFLLAVSQGDNAMQIGDLHLTSMRGENGAKERWNVELTLTTLVFSPNSSVSK